MISRRTFLKHVAVAVAGATCLGIATGAPKKASTEPKCDNQKLIAPWDYPAPLKAKFTTAAYEDLARAHGNDIEEELTKQLGAELAKVVDEVALKALLSEVTRPPIFPSLALSEIALVQPLDKRTGAIFYLDVKHEKEKRTLRGYG